MSPYLFAFFVVMTSIYSSAVVIRLASGDDTPVWTWPAILASLLVAMVVVLVAMYNILALLRAMIGA